MNNFSRFFVFSLLILVQYACRNKQTIEPEPVPSNDQPVVVDYTPLKIGNYWIYEVFDFDTLGNERIRPQLDSTVVVNNTFIRNQSYFGIRTFPFNTTNDGNFCDSLNYLINASGQRLLSSDDFTNILGSYYTLDSDQRIDTLFKFSLKMANRDSLITVPAGTFKTINAKGTTVLYPKYLHPGSHNPRYSQCLYAKNIGLVYERYDYLDMNAGFGRRLVRFHLN